MIMSLKQREIKCKPRIKLNHNTANIFFSSYPRIPLVFSLLFLLVFLQYSVIFGPIGCKKLNSLAFFSSSTCEFWYLQKSSQIILHYMYSFSFIIVKVEEEPEGETDEEEPDSHSSDRQHEYYRQPVYLSSDKCPYLPHVLHFVRLGTGTVLVLVSEVGS